MKKYFLLLGFLFFVGELSAQCNYCNVTITIGGVNNVLVHNIFSWCPYPVTNTQINWGDGNISNGILTGEEHYYCDTGTYIITYSVVVGGAGGAYSCSSTKVVTLSSIFLNGSLSHTINNGVADFMANWSYPTSSGWWHFGDGTSSSTSPYNTTHAYTTIGTYYAYLEGCTAILGFPSACACTAIYDTVIINCVPQNYIVNTDICKDSSYTFPDSATYSNIIKDTSHTSHFTSLLGCDSNIITNISVTTFDTSIIQLANQLTSNAINVSYQWYYCTNQSLLISDTNQIFIASHSGSFAVILNDGFCIDTSECYVVNSVNVIDISKQNEILIYPNPTYSIFNIKNRKGKKKELYNAVGQLMLSSTKDEIEVRNFCKGVYYLVCEGMSKKVVIE